MNDRELTGKITLPKMLLDRDVLTSEPANRKSAFLDLYAWANDRARTVNVGGVNVPLKRGQLCYSQQTLAKFWRWDKDKVHRVLTEFQNEGLIKFEATNRTTLITIIDYDVYNADTEPKPEAEPEADTAAQPEAEPEQKLEVGSGKVEEGRDGPPHSQPVLGETRRFGSPGRTGGLSAKKTGPPLGGMALRIALEQEAKKLRAEVQASPVRPDTDTDLSFYTDAELATLRTELREKKARLKSLDRELAKEVVA